MYAQLASYCISCDYTGVSCQTVFIKTVPAGIPVQGQNNTFDYPILTNVTLMCMVTPVNGSSHTVTSYLWTAVNCYKHSEGINDSCFYGGNKTGQNITGHDLLAQDAGTVTCNATIDGANYTSDPLSLRIAGELHT